MVLALTSFLVFLFIIKYDNNGSEHHTHIRKIFEDEEEDEDEMDESVEYEGDY